MNLKSSKKLLFKIQNSKNVFGIKKYKRKVEQMKLKKVTALALATVMVLGVAACGGSREKKENSKSEDGVVELKFPTYLAGENVGATFFLPQVKRFNEKYEGKYKITVEEVPQASYANKIKQLAQQKKLPVRQHAPGSGGIDRQLFSAGCFSK